MSRHTATIRWDCDGDFAANAYSRAHVWEFDGGTVVPGSASPLMVPLPYSNAEAVDPEEAFIASLSSCHMLWFLDFARRAGFNVARYKDEAVGHMTSNGAGGMWISRVELHPKSAWSAQGPNHSQLEELHHKAHAACFIANSVRSDVVTILN